MRATALAPLGNLARPFKNEMHRNNGQQVVLAVLVPVGKSTGGFTLPGICRLFNTDRRAHHLGGGS